MSCFIFCYFYYYFCVFTFFGTISIKMITLYKYFDGAKNYTRGLYFLIMPVSPKEICIKIYNVPFFFIGIYLFIYIFIYIFMSSPNVFFPPSHNHIKIIKIYTVHFIIKIMIT